MTSSLCQDLIDEQNTSPSTASVVGLLTRPGTAPEINPGSESVSIDVGVQSASGEVAIHPADDGGHAETRVDGGCSDNGLRERHTEDRAGKATNANLGNLGNQNGVPAGVSTMVLDEQSVSHCVSAGSRPEGGFPLYFCSGDAARESEPTGVQPDDPKGSTEGLPPGADETGSRLRSRRPRTVTTDSAVYGLRRSELEGLGFSF